MGFLSSQDVYGVPWVELPVETAAEHTHVVISSLPKDRAHKVNENKRKKMTATKF